jgi:hypothetical protein
MRQFAAYASIGHHRPSADGCRLMAPVLEWLPTDRLGDNGIGLSTSNFLLRKTKIDVIAVSTEDAAG